MGKGTMFYVSPLCKLLLSLAFAGLLAMPVAGHAGHKHGADEDAPTVDLRDPKLLGNKGGAMVVFFFVPFLTCIAPYFIRFGTRYLTYGLLFGAGLFFTISVEHLIPDSAAGFAALKPNDTYPTAYMLVIVGFLATMLADTVAQYVLQYRAEENTCQAPSPENLHSVYTTGRVQQAAGGPMSPPLDTPNNNKDLALTIDKSGSNHHQCSPVDISRLNVGDLVLLVLALCFHAIFEGLVIGLSLTVSDVWNNTSTIVVHKVFEGLALGMSLMVDGTRTLLSVILYATAFSISAPVGIAIGMILGTATEPRTSQWVGTVGNGIAAGVFIFVAISHILPKGLKRKVGDPAFAPFLKWFAFGLGCMTTSLIQLKSD